MIMKNIKDKDIETKKQKLTTGKMLPWTLQKVHVISGHTEEFIYEVWDRLADAELDRISKISSEV